MRTMYGPLTIRAAIVRAAPQASTRRHGRRHAATVCIPSSVRPAAAGMSSPSGRVR